VCPEVDSYIGGKETQQLQLQSTQLQTSIITLLHKERGHI